MTLTRPPLKFGASGQYQTQGSHLIACGQIYGFLTNGAFTQQILFVSNGMFQTFLAFISLLSTSVQQNKHNIKNISVDSLGYARARACVCVGGSILLTLRSPQILFYPQVKSKGKVVPVLFVTEHHAMKAYWGVEV
jgi:hypothetical protein